MKKVSLRDFSGFFLLLFPLPGGGLLFPPGREPLPGPAQFQRWVEELCAPAMAGRRACTKGARLAADLVAREFCLAGLKPAGERGSFFQEFPVKAPGAEGRTRNVLGLLEGRGPRADQVLVVSAHYDHLGMGGPESRWQGKPAVHPGADDNASGVSCLLGLARAFSRVRDRLVRSILFTSWGAEEEGGLGSKWWLEHPTIPLERVVFLVNLDMVGHLRGKILCGAAASAKGMPSLLRKLAGPAKVAVLGRSFGGSDHQNFLKKKIPAIHLFTGAWEGYHTPLDRPDKIDPRGIREVAGLAFRILSFESLSQEPPVLDPEGMGSLALPCPKGARPSLGTVPDFSQVRGGYKIAKVKKGSPAGKAGLRAGDLIVEFGGKPVDGFLDFVAALFSHLPGDQVEIQVLRGGKRLKFQVKLGKAAGRPGARRGGKKGRPRR